MDISLGFSPCPNDTFIFDALVNNKIENPNYQFHVEYQDVETLNQKAFKGELDVTKLSFHAFSHLVDKYELLDSGSALGFGVGPLLICKDSDLAAELSSFAGKELPDKFKNLKIGIPGKFTTANFLIGLAFPQLTNKVELVFSEIENALLSEEIDLGLIIHENRFTYQDKGLHKIVDLGKFWEEKTNSPIPLGGIVVKRSLPLEVKKDINKLVRNSVVFGFENPTSGTEYIKAHAQEMDENVISKHIELYVNTFTEDLGTEGKQAILNMFKEAQDLKLIPLITKNIFIEK